MSWFHHKVLLTCSFFSLPNAVLGLPSMLGVVILKCHYCPVRQRSVLPSSPPGLLVPVPLLSPCSTPSFPPRRAFRAVGFRARRQLYLVRLSAQFRFVQARRGFPRDYGEAGGDLFGCLPWDRFAFLWFFPGQEHSPLVHDGVVSEQAFRGRRA